MTTNTDTIKLWCPCSVTQWNQAGQSLHIKLNGKLICTKCGRGNN